MVDATKIHHQETAGNVKGSKSTGMMECLADAHFLWLAKEPKTA